MLLLALIFYLHYEAPEEEQNFAMVMEMLRAAAIEDEEDNRPSPRQSVCRFEMDNPDHIALKYYRSYHSGSAKTLKSIQITLAARLEKFNLESLAALTSADELDLASMGEKKTALFALIPIMIRASISSSVSSTHSFSSSFFTPPTISTAAVCRYLSIF